MAKNFFKRTVDFLRGKPSKPKKPSPPPKPKNYRAIDFNIGGKYVQIGGMANPSFRGQDPNQTINFLKEQGYTTLISLDYKADNEKIAEKAGIDFLNQHVTDFEAPSIEQLDEIYTQVNTCVASGGKPAIHCGEGFGRTGSVLAAIKLKELMLAAPMDELNNQTQSESVQLGHYGGNKNVACSPMVKKAIELVRACQGSGNSVENQKQVDRLCEYEQAVLAQRLKSSPPSSKEDSMDDSLPPSYEEAMKLPIDDNFKAEPNDKVTEKASNQLGGTQEKLEDLEKKINKNMAEQVAIQTHLEQAVNKAPFEKALIDKQTKLEILLAKHDVFIAQDNPLAPNTNIPPVVPNSTTEPSNKVTEKASNQLGGTQEKLEDLEKKINKNLAEQVAIKTHLEQAVNKAPFEKALIDKQTKLEILLAKNDVFVAQDNPEGTNASTPSIENNPQAEVVAIPTTPMSEMHEAPLKNSSDPVLSSTTEYNDQEREKASNQLDETETQEKRDDIAPGA